MHTRTHTCTDWHSRARGLVPPGVIAPVTAAHGDALTVRCSVKAEGREIPNLLAEYGYRFRASLLHRISLPFPSLWRPAGREILPEPLREMR